MRERRTGKQRQRLRENREKGRREATQRKAE